MAWKDPKASKWGLFWLGWGRWKEPAFLPQNSHKNQLQEDRFWPLKHGLQQHERMEEKDTSFLKKLTRKRCLGVVQRALLKRNQEGSLGSWTSRKGWRKGRETHHFMLIKWRKEYVEGSLNLKNSPKHGGSKRVRLPSGGRVRKASKVRCGAWVF